MKADPFFVFLIAASLAGCSDQHSAENLAIGRTSAEIELLCDALSSHFAEHGVFPKSQRDFENSLTTGSEALLRTRVLKDEWGRMIRYSGGGTAANVTSDAVRVGDPSDDIGCSLSVEGDQVRRESRNVFGRKEVVTVRPIADFAPVRTE